MRDLNTIEKPKKILFTTSVGSHWGSEQSLFNLVNNLDRKKFNPFVMTVWGSLQHKLNQNRIPYKIYNSHTLSKKEILKFCGLVFHLSRFIRKKEFALVHTNDIHAAQYSTIAAWLVGVPSILHIRNVGLDGWLGRKNKAIFRLATRTIAISKATEESLLEIGVSADKIQIIHNAVDLNEFNANVSAEPFRIEAKINNHDPLIGLVGRITPHKGQDIFIQAIPAILKKFPTSKFAIVGEDTSPNNDFEKKLRELIGRLNLEGKVYFSGFKSNIAPVMKALDILVVPSTSEPFGRVVVEAMAMKTPVVATNVDGIPDIIKDGKNGILVQKENYQAISVAVLRLLSQKELYSNICENGKKLVEKKYSIPVHVEKIEELYQSVLSRN